MSELRLLSQSALRYRRQILSIKQFLAARACTTLLLDGITSANSRDDRQLESVCHGVIVLRRDELAYGAERRQMSIRKIRGSKPSRFQALRRSAAPTTLGGSVDNNLKQVLQLVTMPTTAG